MPRFLIRDSVTYDRTWTVDAADEEAALAQAISHGPGADLVEEQSDNEPYTADRIVRQKKIGQGVALTLENGERILL